LIGDRASYAESLFTNCIGLDLMLPSPRPSPPTEIATESGMVIDQSKVAIIQNFRELRPIARESQSCFGGSPSIGIDSLQDIQLPVVQVVRPLPAL
jgi:hypothetical protein